MKAMLALFFFGTLSAPALQAADTPTPAAAPNVLILTIDTWRADYIGVSGKNKVKTPNLDALAAQGAYFPETYTSSPMTTPGHATILSGLLPPSHTIRDNTHGKFKQGLPTLATILKSKGYATAAFVSAYPLIRAYGLDAGFDTYDDQLNFDPNKLDFNLQWRPGSQTLDRAEAWLKGAKRPFFAWVHFFEPHAPYEPPEPFASTYAKDLYAGEVAYADALAGRLVEILKGMKVLDHTLIVVCGDHGEGLGEHGEATHSLLVYQPTITVPLIFRLPGRFKAGVHRQRASLADVAPTVLDDLGVPIARPMDGISLKPLIAGTKTSHPPVYAESYHGFLNFGIDPITVWAEGDRKLHMKPKPEFYDLAKDPKEEKNLMAEPAGRTQANAMGRALKIWLKQHETAAPTPATGVVPGLDPNALKSLGYLSGRSTAASAKGMDAVDFLPWFNKMNKARELGASGQFGDAVILYNEILARFPDSTLALSELGIIMVTTQDLLSADSLFSKALAIDPSDPTALLNMGNIKMVSKDYQASEKYLRTLVELYPNHMEATYNLAGLYFYYLKDYGQAAEFAKRFIELFPDAPQAATMRAILQKTALP